MSVDETVHTVCCLCIWIDLLFMPSMSLAAPTLNAYSPIHGRPSFLLGLCPSVCGELLVNISSSASESAS